jgi:two-component system, OmpR family, sensor histidine kinase TctE
MSPPGRPRGEDWRAQPEGTPVSAGVSWATLTPWGRLSLRSRLLLGIGAPVLALMVFNAVGLYRQALAAADTAYDRTLLASAKAIGELLELEPASGREGPARLRGNMSYSALEAFEADNRSRIYYRVSGFQGEMVSGFADLPPPRRESSGNKVYAALVDFYDDRFRDEPVRMAVLLQPVAGDAGQGMATIQVAETLELRRTLARQLLLDTLWRQGALLIVVAVVVLWVVQRATQPLRQLSEELRHRDEADLAPLSGGASAPRELRPIVEATNGLMARLAHLLAHQQRFVRDASHQLRTPLAVLKTQLQSAQRGDLPPAQALQEMAVTVERATELANQMLALAKVEQLRQQGDAGPIDAEPVVRAVALDLAPLMAERQLDFEITSQPLTVRAHAWALRELTRNLLHNAIKHSPESGRLSLVLQPEQGLARLSIDDDGPGIPAELRERLFQPFSTAAAASPAAISAAGSGLGLAICREIVASLGGSIRLDERPDGPDATGRPRPSGLSARVTLPQATPP